MHENARDSTFKQFQDDLDPAVFNAYGWPQNLIEAQILERLVALNAERAREESQGKMRWLRPDYQMPIFSKKSKTATFPLPLGEGQGEGSKSRRAAQKSKPKTKIKNLRTPWPKFLAERAKAIEPALRAANAAITPEALAKQFLRAKPADITEILETLCTLGLAKRENETYSF